MKKTIVLAATLAVAAGCGGKSKDKGTGEMGSGMSSGSAMASGSADMVGTGSAAAVETKPAPPPPPPPPPAKTPDEMAARYQECWGLWNDGKWDAFKSCYTPDAVSSQPGSAMPDLSGVDAIAGDSQNQRAGFPDMHGDLQLVLQGSPGTLAG